MRPLFSACLSGWLALALTRPALAGSELLPTRFGALTVKYLDNAVLTQGRVYYRGRPLHPDVTANNALGVSGTFHLAHADVVLFLDEGGTACPFLWYFVTVSAHGASSTHAFGSCGRRLAAVQKGQTIVLTTRGYMGPFEPKAARMRALAQTHTYIYSRGVVTENGKPVGCEENCT